MAVRRGDVDLERDAALVLRFQIGDASAFDELYRHYFGRLCRYCARRLGSDFEAEDVAQEAFVRALRALPGFKGERRFYPWICVIAGNLCANTLRRRGQNEPGPVEEHAEDDCRLEELIESVDKALLRAALTKLSRRHRAALQLWSAGAPSADIAARLGCTPGTADVTVHRARRRLRDRYLVLSGERSRWSLVPGVGAGLRWWDRVRARVSPKVAAVSDFCSPLAAKAAAALFVVSVTSSAGAASAGIVTMQAGLPTRPTVVLPAGVPARAATGRPAAVSSGIAVRESTRDAAVPRPRAEGPRGRSVKVGPLETPVREVTYDEFQEECRGAEIYVEKGGFAACANPHEAVRRVQSKIPAPR